MAKTHCFTSATFAYLDRVRVLGETLRRHHPDWSLSLCLPDKPPPGFTVDFAMEVFDHVATLQELDIPQDPGWIFEHEIVELCTAAKGAMLCRLLDQGAEKIIYLDPDIALFGSLQPVVDRLDTHDILLTPHLLAPEAETIPIIDHEIGALKHGIFNLGFLAVAGRGEGQRFARWWCRRLRDFCFDDIAGGLFTDQRWCDHVPALFDRVHIVRDPGYNVASWNLGQRPLAITGDGSLLAGGCPLRFFHFTKVPGIGEAMIEAYAGGRIEAFELLAWYRARLAAHAVAGLPPGWWAYGHYDDGSPIHRDHRIAYRRQNKHDRVADPFAAGPAIFETR